MVWRFVEVGLGGGTEEDSDTHTVEYKEATENSHVVLVSDNSQIECKIKQEERARRVASSHKKARV